MRIHLQVLRIHFLIQISSPFLQNIASEKMRAARVCIVANLKSSAGEGMAFPASMAGHSAADIVG